jgi:hypothetical protein
MGLGPSLAGLEVQYSTGSVAAELGGSGYAESLTDASCLLSAGFLAQTGRDSIALVPCERGPRSLSFEPDFL